MTVRLQTLAKNHNVYYKYLCKFTDYAVYEGTSTISKGNVHNYGRIKLYC